MGENPNLKLLVEGLGYLATIIVSVAGVYAMRLRARQNEMALSKNVDPKSLPNIGIILIVFGCALLASLFARHPEMAQRILPPAESAERVASAAPMIAGCTSASDCRSGCACTGGQCTPCSAAEKKPKTQPPQKKPRLVASMDGALCADCLRLPQMLTPIAQPFDR